MYILFLCIGQLWYIGIALFLYLLFDYVCMCKVTSALETSFENVSTKKYLQSKSKKLKKVDVDMHLSHSC